MRKLLGLLSLLLSASVTLPALAGPNDCDKGDALMGPNCVHTETVNVRGMNYSSSVVYRVKGGTKTIVWADQGTVEKSTAAYLIVDQLVEGDDGYTTFDLVRYNWNAKLHCYARPGGCYLK